MKHAAQIRVGGLIHAGAYGLVVPGFLVGPTLTGQLSFAALPGWAPWVAGVSALLGVLTAIAAVFARVEAVERIAESGWAAEYAPLFMPVLLWKAIGRRDATRREESAKK